MSVGEDFSKKNTSLASGWSNHLEWEGLAMHVPFGSALTGMNNGSSAWAGQKLKYLGSSWDVETHRNAVNKVKGLALQYLNTHCGEDGAFGVDCSGLTQIVYRFIDIRLPRDAWQTEKGEKVSSLASAQIGDLAFLITMREGGARGNIV